MGDKFDLDSEFSKDYQYTLKELMEDCKIKTEVDGKNRNGKNVFDIAQSYHYFHNPQNSGLVDRINKYLHLDIINNQKKTVLIINADEVYDDDYISRLEEINLGKFVSD